MKKQINTITGYENCHDYYVVDSKGVIYGKNDKKLNPTIGGNDYLVVSLYGKNTIIRTTSLHLIVAKAFLKPPSNETFTEIIHKDGNRLNNNLDNLCYATIEERLGMEKQNGRSGKTTKKCLNPIQVVNIREMLEDGYTGRDISERLGININTVYNVKRGTIYKYYVREENGDIVNRKTGEVFDEYWICGRFNGELKFADWKYL